MPPAWPGRAVIEDVKIRNGPKPISLIGSTGSIGTQVTYTVLVHTGPCIIRYSSLFPDKRIHLNNLQ